MIRISLRQKKVLIILKGEKRKIYTQKNQKHVFLKLKIAEYKDV